MSGASTGKKFNSKSYIRHVMQSTSLPSSEEEEKNLLF
jgi:hypothetical protein